MIFCAKTADIAKLLTEQEYKIALLAAERRTNAMIAEEMNLTENTVKTHLKHIFDKVGIAGNAKNKRHLLADMMNSERIVKTLKNIGRDI